MRFLSDQEKVRYQAAQELGLLEKLLQVGWPGLTSAESGRIGGHISAKRRKQHAPANTNINSEKHHRKNNKKGDSE